jgi:hypothetical protein
VNFLFGSAGGDLSKEELKLLEEAEMRIVAVGGPTAGVVELTGADKITALQNYFRIGQDYALGSGGVPISYTLRYINDGRLARLSYSADFEQVTEQVVVPKKISDFKVRMYTETDDKDNQDSVFLEVHRGKQLIAESDRLGFAEVWGDQDNNNQGRPRVFTLKPKSSVSLDDVGDLDLTISKRGSNDGWHFSVSMYAAIENEPDVRILKRSEVIKLGDDDAQFRVIELED